MAKRNEPISLIHYEFTDEMLELMKAGKIVLDAVTVKKKQNRIVLDFVNDADKMKMKIIVNNFVTSGATKMDLTNATLKEVKIKSYQSYFSTRYFDASLVKLESEEGNATAIITSQPEKEGDSL